MNKTVWRFWTMFQFHSLEQWLSDMALQGWMFQGVKHHYGFLFRQQEPAKMTFRFDFRGYILEDYISELFRRHWTMTKINKYWVVWARPYDLKDQMIITDSDDEVLEGLKRISWIQASVVLCSWIIPFVIFRVELTNPIVLGIYLIVNFYLSYNLIRIVFYRAMVEARNEMV
ncbi:MAG: DUF2812 domain-containing protein [Erysipelotrichaceae bacterium]|nr:DUF2812 domain-containing protein [Erysipelotrichaceae bacterium]